MSGEAAAEFLLERAKTEPKVQRLIQDAEVLDQLRLHDKGWQRLYEIVQSKKRHFIERLAARQMAGEAVPQREIDFERGFYAGAEWAASHPVQAIKSLEKAATYAYALSESQPPEETSPYISS